MLENKKNILFDMDGLLIDSESLGIKMWEKVFQKHHEPFNPQAAYQTIGSNGLASQEILEKLTGNRNYFKRFREEKIKETRQYLNDYPMPVKKGAHELLTYLKEHHYTIVLTSSTFEPDVLFSLKSAGLDQYFDKFVCGDHVKRAKPNPEIFNQAIERYHLNKDETLILEDSKNGILAADAAGIDVIGIPDLVDISTLKLPHLLSIEENLLKVLDFLKEIH